jgi:endonuclease/exonuclease/phosphatase family metal-dependent hydrolase
MRAFFVVLCCLLSTRASGAAPGSPQQLHLATWNLEWLLTPETSLRLRVRCLRGERHLPCDVAQDRPRSAADFAALAREAKKLDADVVALQEVEDAAAAEHVFGGYRFCFTQRRGWQNVGFAIRAGVPYRCEPDETAMALGDKVRRGAVLTLFPGETRELHLLAVHLKSGCSSDPLDASPEACHLLARQAPGISQWIRAQAAHRFAFAVLGDFNRDLRGEAVQGAGLWASLSGSAALQDAGSGTPFRACHSGKPFTRYIDYILLGPALAQDLVPGSFVRHVYADRDAHRFRLSDHCPLSVRVRLR